MSDLANSFQTFSEWLVKNTGQTYNCVVIPRYTEIIGA